METTLSANLVWIDLEMTGLDPSKDRIIEMAIIITDSDLNELAVGPVLAIQQPQSLLDGMDDWNQSSSLGVRPIAARASNPRSPKQRLKPPALAFLEAHVKAGQAPLCGNTIWQDRRFLSRYMPDLERLPCTTE